MCKYDKTRGPASHVDVKLMSYYHGLIDIDNYRKANRLIKLKLN